MVLKKTLKTHLKIHLRERGVTEEEAQTQGRYSIEKFYCFSFKVPFYLRRNTGIVVVYFFSSKLKQEVPNLNNK